MQDIDTISQVPVEERPGDEKDGELKHLERLENDGSGVHISKTVTAGIASNVEDFWSLVREANEANEAERGMPLKVALRTYPKAMAWSMILSSAIIMEGYDTAVVGNFWGFTPFLEIFGVPDHNGKLQVPSSWQNGISGGTSVGEIIGLQFAGWAASRYGYRWTIMPALAAMIGFIFIPFFARSLTVLLIGEIFQGMSWGVFQTMTISYAAEVSPVAIRHWFTSYVNMCWFIGQFISAGVLRGLINNQTVWGYRIPFAIQWVWPVPILIGTFLAPESPWFYVKNGDKEKARNSLRRLARRGVGTGDREIDRQLALLIYTNEMEKEQAPANGVSYLDCFKGTDLRRTEIVCMTWIAQTMCGSSLGGLQSFFYEAAGISPTSSFDLGLGQTAIGIVGNVASWFILGRVGRRQLLLGGMMIIFVFLIIIGAMGVPKHLNSAESWVAGTMVLLISCVYGFSIGPVVYNIVAEVPSTRTRAKSVVLARNAYNIIGVAFVNIVTYRQLNADSWNWGPKAGFFWAGANVLFTIYLYFRLPETKGRTYADLDILFENKVPARKFASTKIESLVEAAERAL